MGVVASSVCFEQLVNQSGCLDLVEKSDSFAKALLGESFNVVLIELVLLDELQNEVPLFVGALPSRTAFPLVGL